MYLVILINMKEILLNNWNFFRILRVGLGLLILVQGIIAGDILSAGLGALFAGLAVFNVGCCGANGCHTNYTNTNRKKEITHVEFEEVVADK